MKTAEQAIRSAVLSLRAEEIRYEAALQLFEDVFIEEALLANKGNQCATALEMGLHRNTVSRRMSRVRWYVVATLKRGSLLKKERVSPIVEAVLNDAERNPAAYLPRVPIEPVTVERMMELATKRRA